jgi:hypothetical protein
LLTCKLYVTRSSLKQISIGHVAVAVFIGAVCFYFYKAHEVTDKTAATETYRLMNELDPDHQYKFLYTDQNLLRVIHAALPLRELNPASFSTLLRSTNEVLRRELLLLAPSERSVDDLDGVIEIANRYSAEAIASMHALIFSLPERKRAYYTLYQSCLDDFRVMMLNHERRMYDLVNTLNSARGIDVSTPPARKFGRPKPYTKDELTEEVIYFFKK